MRKNTKLIEEQLKQVKILNELRRAEKFGTPLIVPINIGVTQKEIDAYKELCETMGRNPNWEKTEKELRSKKFIEVNTHKTEVVPEMDTKEEIEKLNKEIEIIRSNNRNYYY